LSAAETGKRLQELLTRLDETLAELERADDSEQAVDRLSQMAELAREVQAEIDRLRRETPDAPA
jgi:primosomal protein N''